MGLLDTFLGGQNKSEESVAKVKDPVCGMEIDPKTAAASVEKDGQKYYFCSDHCRGEFEGQGNQPSHSGGHGCC